MPHLTAAAAFCAALLLSASPSAAGGVPEPDGYRLSDYRAPTPDGLAGATTLDTEGVRALLERGGAIPINVLKLERSTLPAAALAAATAAAADSRQPVAAQCRPRRAGRGDGRLVRGRAALHHRRKQCARAAVLMSGRPLDVLERGQARPLARVPERALVPGRDGRVDRGRLADGGGDTISIGRPMNHWGIQPW